MSINKDIKEIIETFNMLDDWEDKYALIIELGKELPEMNQGDKTDKNLVKGCVSKVWLAVKQQDERFLFSADSDSHIVRGLIAIILATVNGKTKKDIAETDFTKIFSELDLEQNLSPNRRNGFYSMIEHIKRL